MIPALLLKFSGLIGPAIEGLKKLPKSAWVILAFLAFGGACFYFGGERVRKQYRDAPADTSATITSHVVPLPPTEGSGTAIKPVAFDTAGFESRMQSAYDLEKKVLAQTYITEMDSIRGEILVLRKMNRALAEEKRFRDSTGQGTINIAFNPLRDYPRGYFWYRYDPAPFTYYDTTRNITKHVVDPRPLVELFANVGVGTELTQPFKDMSGWFKPGVQVNLGKAELSFQAGPRLGKESYMELDGLLKYYLFRGD